MRKLLTLALTLAALATFSRAGTAQQTAALTVNIGAGVGRGTVTSNPAGIVCGTACSQNYSIGVAVMLLAQPNPGSVFAGWSGDCAGTESSIVVTIAPPTSGMGKTCVATFNAAPLVTLTAIRAGTGSGTVTSNPAGIVCGTACTQGYAMGIAVMLLAQPDPGSVFASWIGDCTGAASSTAVTMTPPISGTGKTCVATFNAAPPVTLTAGRTGTGSGAVTSSPAGIACGATCAHSYSTGIAVTLTAQPDPGSVFAGWTGDCTGTAPDTSVTMGAATRCTATFNAAPSVSLTAAKTGTGNGTVTSFPLGIACGAPTCTAGYPTGTVVVLMAAPGPGSVFAGWSGACAGTAPGTSVTMSAATRCTATFDAAPSVTLNAAPSVTLTATKAGTGSGTVTSSPAGIACGATCAQSYSMGTAVTLTATPDPGSVFAGWSGACAGTASGTSVTMSAAKSCTAQFDQADPGKCDLVISQSPTTDTAIPLVSGQGVAFEIIVKNQGTGTCLAHIPVIDAFAAGLTYASGGASGWVCPKWHTIGPNSATCTNSQPLAPGQSSLLVVTFDVTAPPPSVIENCATVRNADDTNLVNNEACVELPVVPRRPIDCRPPMVPNAAGRTCVCPPGTVVQGPEGCSRRPAEILPPAAAPHPPPTR